MGFDDGTRHSSCLWTSADGLPPIGLREPPFADPHAGSAVAARGSLADQLEHRCVLIAIMDGSAVRAERRTRQVARLSRYR
jgi:hypothetical protein